ncbi:MAG: M23 family metallopeptidase [Mycobacterium sp.]
MQHGVVRTALVALIATAAVVLASCSAVTGDKTTTRATGPATPAASTTAPTSAEPAAFTPVVGSVVAQPVAVPATDGKTHLAYELELTNMLGQDVTLTSVAAVTDDRTLLTLSGDQLTHWTRAVGRPDSPTAKLGAGQSALVWIDIPLEQSGSADLPTDIFHSVSVAASKPSPPLLPATVTERLAPTTVQQRQPIAISPPLFGRDWLDGNSCCAMTPHRMAVNPLNGGLWAAERFAIDYVQLQPDGRLVTGDPEKLGSYPYYGHEIHAVSDGPVVAAVDRLPDQVPGADPAGLRLDEYGGNYIVQDIGGGNYAFYAHLKPGSVRVKAGEALTTGQVIGALGNSGNSSAPHLHFHVMSTPDPLRADGLPFVLTRFQLTNRLADMATLDQIQVGEPARMQAGFQPSAQSDVSPLVLDVMTYGNP